MFKNNSWQLAKGSWQAERIAHGAWVKANAWDTAYNERYALCDFNYGLQFSGLTVYKKVFALATENKAQNCQLPFANCQLVNKFLKSRPDNYRELSDSILLIYRDAQTTFFLS